MTIDGVPAPGAWRRGREVFDAYDADRVLSEDLADDLVNDLVGLRRPARRRPRGGARPGRHHPVRAAAPVRSAAPVRGHLRLVPDRA